MTCLECINLRAKIPILPVVAESKPGHRESRKLYDLSLNYDKAKVYCRAGCLLMLTGENKIYKNVLKIKDYKNKRFSAVAEKCQYYEGDTD